MFFGTARAAPTKLEACAVRYLYTNCGQIERLVRVRRMYTNFGRRSRQVRRSRTRGRRKPLPAEPARMYPRRVDLAETLGRERFLREIQLAARLNHPNILPLYDSGETSG